MSKKDRFIKRLFEIYPGILAWTVITSPFWGGILFPEVIAYFVLVFNAFWVYKSLSSVLFFIIGYFKIRDAENADWMSKLKRLDNIEAGKKELVVEINELEDVKFSDDIFKKKPFQNIPLFLKKILFNMQKRKTGRHLRSEIKELEKVQNGNLLNWKEIHQVIIVPFWAEPYPVLKRSLDRLVSQTFPKSQISVVLGAEERYPPAFKLAKRLQKEYKDKFENLWINNHVLAGEDIIGKASNMADCGKVAKRKIEELKWDKSKIIVTSCDCDTQFDKQYLAYLAYLFVTDKDRYTHFYAAPMLYYANFWKVPFYSRVANTLFSINNIATAARIDKFIQVSSYSFSWKLLEDINFWSVDIIPEDFHMFFKALFVHYDKVLTRPIFLRNLSDAAESIGHASTIKNQYEQVKRWAWGVSDHGWMIMNLLRAKKKTFYMFYRVFHTIFDHVTWSVISFILMFGANIPTLVNKDFSRTVFGQKLPQVSSFMLTITTATFIFTVILDFFIKPRRKEKVSILKLILEQVQWITFPVVSFIFGAIPGLDAQTRLLFGKYMEYRLTEKH
ncbi:glycosyltransferase family 2 protein [Candidatus Dojkabacteria bacterium]|nr:glycosyltransferase family 2 protein [Candidatus Dojkabacteria bacterium]